MKRSGVADLPLHGGRVPQWLAERMTLLGMAIAETIVHDYGTSAFLILNKEWDSLLTKITFP